MKQQEKDWNAKNPTVAEESKLEVTTTKYSKAGKVRTVFAQRERADCRKRAGEWLQRFDRK